MQPKYVRIDVWKMRERARSTYSLNDVVNKFLCLVDFFLSVGHDQAMEVLFLVTGVSGIGATFSFLDGSFSTDSDFGLGFCFHFLQGVTTGSDK